MIIVESNRLPIKISKTLTTGLMIVETSIAINRMKITEAVNSQK